MSTPSKEELESIRILVNNQPVSDFMGLSPNEMHDLIYTIFESGSLLKINSAISDHTLDQIPFFRLTEEFLKIIERDGLIKLTPLGALPKKTLVELYSHRLILEEGVEIGIHKLTREMDSLAITFLHYNTVFAKLVLKKNGKLYLTKEGIKLLVSGQRNSLFRKTLQAYTEKLNWSDFDGYPNMPIGNMGWGFTILLLLKFGTIPREQKFYAENYLKAFPVFFDTFPKNNPLFDNPGKALIRAYCLRSFMRFMEWWGFVKGSEPKSPKSRVEMEGIKILKTEVLDEIFTPLSFDINVSETQ